MASPAGTDQPPAGSRAPAAPATQASTPDWRRWTLRNYLIACLVALGVGSIMIAGWSLAVGGIGWDARTDTAAALQVRAIPSSDSLAQAYDAVYLNSEFYGVFIQQFADLLHTVFTGSTHHLQPDDSATYLYQGGITLASVGLLRHGPCSRRRARVPLRPRGGVRVVADACHAPVARDVAPGLQGRAGRRRPHPDHRRAHLQHRDPATPEGDASRRAARRRRSGGRTRDPPRQLLAPRRVPRADSVALSASGRGPAAGLARCSRP